MFLPLHPYLHSTIILHLLHPDLLQQQPHLHLILPHNHRPHPWIADANPASFHSQALFAGSAWMSKNESFLDLDQDLVRP